MAYHTTIDFRGERKEVAYTWQYDPSVGVDGVDEWWFDGLTAEQFNALNVTAEEDVWITMDIAANHYG